jgi:hypothetical protein
MNINVIKSAWARIHRPSPKTIHTLEHAVRAGAFDESRLQRALEIANTKHAINDLQARRADLQARLDRAIYALEMVMIFDSTRLSSDPHRLVCDVLNSENRQSAIYNRKSA